MFIKGIIAMLPITIGVIPFGLVMGTVAANAQLSSLDLAGMNILVFAGASQLAAVDLMTKDTPSIIVILTGLIINLRMVLYSASMSQYLKNSSFVTKLFASYCLTDQSYAVTVANEEKLKNISDKLSFYFGSSIMMILTWQVAVTIGYVFGNIAPSSWSLDFAVPLSFVALIIPSLKSRNHLYVAAISAMLSIVFTSVPYKLGLLISALLAILFGAYLSSGNKVRRG